MAPWLLTPLSDSCSLARLRHLVCHPVGDPPCVRINLRHHTTVVGPATGKSANLYCSKNWIVSPKSRERCP
eukprot:5819540-Lingulodinium_polyedra.AAC.1